MASSTQRNSGNGDDQPRWRPTRIRDWRGFNGMTLEAVSERLSQPPYNLVTGITYNSLSRVENGEQMPKIELIEALAHLYKTDIHSLLNRLPTVPQGRRVDFGDLADIWDEAGDDDRAKIVAIAKTIVTPKD